MLRGCNRDNRVTSAVRQGEGASMPDEFFTAAAGDDHDPRVLWSGHCAVAEYAFEEPNSLPRWTLPEETEVVITDDRVVYRDVATGAAGELHWPWPQHLRVQPGNRATGRAATVTQIQLVCAGPGGTFPALVFAGGDLATVGDADRLANVLRQAIARYRVEHAVELGIAAEQVRMLSRLVIGPEFANYQGGEGQTVTLLGSIAVDWPVGYAPEPLAEEPFLDPYAGDPGWPAAGRTEFDGLDAAAARPAADPAHAFDRAAAAHSFDPAAHGFNPAAAYSFDPAARSFDPAAYGLDPAARSLDPATYGLDPATRSLDPAAYGLDPATRSLDPATYGLDPAARPVDPAAYGLDPASPVDEVTEVRPLFDSTAPVQPRQADDATLRGTSDLAARAADLAARVAGLVAEGTDLGRYEPGTANLSSYLDGQPRLAPDIDVPTENRAEQIRRTAARLATNSARGRTVLPRRGDDEPARRRP
jgi:hypothetical protein